MWRVVGVSVGAGCAPLVADLFQFCYERDFVMSLSVDGQTGIVDAFGAASRCLGGVLNISDVYFDNVVGQVCPSGLGLGVANASDTEAAFVDLHLSISGDVVSTKFVVKMMALVLGRRFPIFWSLCSSLCILWCLCLSALCFCRSVWPCC